MRKHQTGSAIIEGMTAITIFSIGILGIIGLQARVLANNAQSQYRAEASYLAEEIIGHAMADAANVTCYTINPVAAGCSDAATASAATTWADRVKAALPGADTTPPSVSYAADGTFTVTIQWKNQTENSWHNYVATTNIQPGA